MPRRLPLGRAPRLAPAALLLLLPAACIPLPYRERNFFRGAALVAAPNRMDVVHGDSVVFERCRGLEGHPGFRRGHCFHLVVPAETIVEGREVVFPGEGARAVLSREATVANGPEDRPDPRPLRGTMRILQVRDQQVTARLDLRDEAPGGFLRFQGRITYRQEWLPRGIWR